MEFPTLQSPSTVKPISLLLSSLLSGLPFSPQSLPYPSLLSPFLTLLSSAHSLSSSQPLRYPSLISPFLTLLSSSPFLLFCSRSFSFSTLCPLLPFSLLY
uniref:Uncharacterized protein n=1 Tax=Cacopsylla melanoneura TaxID=428564 RepID=A0A8D9E8E8_9HEMI